MPWAPKKRCTEPGCPEDQEYRGRCRTHNLRAEAARGTAAARGYTSGRYRSSRTTVLRRDRFCQCDRTDCPHPGHPKKCMAVATEAHHYPESRKELLTRGVLDPDDPRFMKGLCHRCHSRETARHQPGGFNAGRVKLDPLELE